MERRGRPAAWVEQGRTGMPWWWPRRSSVVSGPSSSLSGQCEGSLAGAGLRPWGAPWHHPGRRLLRCPSRRAGDARCASCCSPAASSCSDSCASTTYRSNASIQRYAYCRITMLYTCMLHWVHIASRSLNYPSTLSLFRRRGGSLPSPANGPGWLHRRGSAPAVSVDLEVELPCPKSLPFSLNLPSLAGPDQPLNCLTRKSVADQSRWRWRIAPTIVLVARLGLEVGSRARDPMAPPRHCAAIRRGTPSR